MTGEDRDVATLRILVEHEVDLALDSIADGEPGPTQYEELKDRAKDWFWSNWDEVLAQELPRKEEVSVPSVVIPDSIRYDEDGGRLCTGCGASVEDESYQFWLFHTCPECAAGATADGADQEGSA